MTDYSGELTSVLDGITLGLITLAAGRIDSFEIHYPDGRVSVVRREPKDGKR